MAEFFPAIQGLHIYDWLLAIVVSLLVVVLGMLVILIRRNPAKELSTLQVQLELFERGQDRLERVLREEIATNREESSACSRRNRDEMSGAVSILTNTLHSRMTEIAGLQKQQFDRFSEQLVVFAQLVEQRLDRMRDTLEQRLAALQVENGRKLDQMREESSVNSRHQRDETSMALKGLSDSILKGMTDIGGLLKGHMEYFSNQIRKLTDSNENKLDAVRNTVEERLRLIQDDNSKQLDQMRSTVDEKLQGTLEKRLGESFRHVSERLEQVHKGLGEMQSLASGVGDLKRVLTNVKTRGGWGEIQLEAILQEMLAPDQYERNVRMNETGGEVVEFAIKLPGRGNGHHETVWLPIDAKFPVEDYQRLMEAQERADSEASELAARMLMARIKSCARDICVKYICPPKTTDFGIMFLPTEGLYAEAVRRAGLIETIQRECRVVIAGPTTFAALVNSLQMGFRTLAIQKRSSEVWTLLGAVKTEFGKFGDVLAGVKKKLDQASNTMEDAARRSRAIEKKLRGIQELPAEEAGILLEETDSQLKIDA